MTTFAFHRRYPPAQPAAGPAQWLVFHATDVLARADTPPTLLPGTTQQPRDVAVESAFFLGMREDTPVMVGTLPAEYPLPPGWRVLNLRAALGLAEAEIASLLGYAAQLIYWQRTSRFCASCATPMLANDGWGKKCPNCGYAIYPPVSPATIVLIHDGERILLTTKDGWGKRYGLVAGFVEPGESFEACVAREVHEEVGVDLTDIRYIASQPWPFPHQIMVGFMACYAGGEIVIDTNELVGAGWFTRDALPELPPPFSIARQLIERWLRDGAPEP